MKFFTKPSEVLAWQYCVDTFNAEELPDWLKDHQVTATDSCLVVDNSIFCYDHDYLVKDEHGLCSMQELVFDMTYFPEEDKTLVDIFELEAEIESLAKELDRRKPSNISAKDWKKMKKKLRGMERYHQLLMEIL